MSGVTFALGSVLAVALAIGVDKAWRRWRFRPTARLGGVLLLFPILYCVVYAVGSLSVSANSTLFGIRVSGAQWVLYGLGLGAFILGAALCRVKLPALAATSTGVQRLRQSGPESFALSVGIIGLILSMLNLATGSIPILSGNIDAVRFAGQGGVLGKVWFAIDALNEFAFVFLSMGLFTARSGSVSRVRRTLTSGLVMVLALVLVATGARSFLVISVLSVVIVIVEARRPRLSRTVIATLIGVCLIGIAGYARFAFSGESAQASGQFERAGFGSSVFAPAFASLSVGPRVFQMVRTEIPAQVPYQDGKWAARDGAVLIRGHQLPSDRWITTFIMARDPNENGGMPPTVLGGLYVDWGSPGIVVGMLVLGYVTARSRAAYYRRQSLAAATAFGYWSAYLCISLYSFVSLKPTALIVLVLCGVAGVVGRRPPPQAVGKSCVGPARFEIAGSLASRAALPASTG